MFPIISPAILATNGIIVDCTFPVRKYVVSYGSSNGSKVLGRPESVKKYNRIFKLKIIQYGVFIIMPVRPNLILMFNGNEVHDRHCLVVRSG